jgi:hypothetical protein
VTAAHLGLTIRRSVAVLILALGILGIGVVRGNEALLLLLLAGPLAYLVGSYVLEPLTDASDGRDESAPDREPGDGPAE